MQFNVLDALNEYNISLGKVEDKKATIHCPYHDDTNPSGVIFLETGVFHCRVCDLSTNIFRFLQQKLGRDVYHEINLKFSVSLDKVLNPETIENAHGKIFDAKFSNLVKELKRRSISEELIRKFRLGILKDRVSIPVRNEAGFFVNIRLYKPGGDPKTLNFPKHGKPPRYFPIDQLQYDTIVLHGGELKALSVLEELNSREIGSVCATHGEGTLPTELISRLEGKTVFICMDIDKAGQAASIKHATAISQVASWVGVLDLPLDIVDYPHGDVNDYLIDNTPTAFADLLQDVPKYEYVQDSLYLKIEKPSIISLSLAVHADNTRRRVQIKSVVSTLDVSPYTIPSIVKVKCDRSEKFCDKCPVSNLLPTDQVMDIPPECPAIIKMIAGTDAMKKEACMEALGIPPMCKKCSFEDQKNFNIEEAKVSEELDLQSTAIERSMQTAFCIGPALELNECYEMVGRMVAHPRSQQATLLISSYTPTQDALSKFECKHFDELQLFQPREWTEESLKEKLIDIYSDFEANITRIFSRQDLHLTYDLAWHSPLWLNFDSRQAKGWVETLVVGDSACGKSTVILSDDQQSGLLTHYNVGEYLDSKGATRSGLLGGSEQIGKRWFVTWGKFPINDRRLVILEELKGASTEVISKLTTMRSSGFAEINSIVKRKTHARTRLIAISNPRSQRNISGFNYGIDAFVELIGALEDLRRFDMCLLVAKDEVDISQFDYHRPEVEHKYVSNLCRELILWSWTSDYARFEDEIHLLKHSRFLCDKYSDEIPIVSRASMRYKLARLSAALAARTFSIDTPKIVLVRKCHVEFITHFLDRLYSNKTFGYLEYSEKLRTSEVVVRPEKVKQRLYRISESESFVEHLLLTEELDVFFIQDTLGLPPDDARELLGFLIRSRCLKREGRQYRKTTTFTQMLKELTMVEKKKPPFSGRKDFE